MPAAVSLLVIDDNPGSVELLSSALAQPGLEILAASNPEQGLYLFRNHRPQVVLTDLVMPQMSGMEVLERIVEIDPATDVILMSAHYSTESAVEAVKKGASDYLNKPVSIDPLRERIGKLVEEVRKRQRAVQLEDELRSTSEFEGIVGRSPLMWEMFWRTRRVAPHYRALLITGETGTGKDLIARAAQTQPCGFRSLRRPQLFGSRGNAVRKRAIWPLERFLHRGDNRQARFVRARSRRHAVSR
jgi:DNA-binding NtrC family response regulator